MPYNRREFLSTATAAAGVALTAARPALGASGASDIRVAVIGLRSRGNVHAEGFGRNVVALCDVDQKILEKRAGEVSRRLGREIDTFSDYRRLLERDDIDAVSIATPNHTHSLIAIESVVAGKDVYVEKPVSHNVWEGRQLVAAARRENRIVQAGTQSRSSPSLQQAVDYVRRGELGKIQYAIGTCYKPRRPIGKIDKPLRIPDHIDYDLWCGPASKVDLYRPSLHYDWHWDWNTGNGDMGNQGIHQMDIARWFLGEERLAPRTISIGGRLGYDDAGNTPNTQVVLHAYEAAPLLFETRGLPRSKAAQRNWEDSMDRLRGSRIGVLVQCEKGHVLIPSYENAVAYDRSGEEIKRWRGAGNHFANFLQAVESRDSGQLNGEIREGHLSSALCHTGGVSHQLGGPVVAGEIAEKIAGDDLLSDSFERMTSHLRANGVDVDRLDSALSLGATLDIDTETERFIGNAAADELFARTGRPPFVVPDLGA